MSVSNKDGTVDVLCKLLKTWGQCSDEVIEYMRATTEEDLEKGANEESLPNKLLKRLNQALDTDVLKEKMNEIRIRKQLQEREEEEESKALQSLSSSQSIPTASINLEEVEEVKPIDVMSNNALKSRLQSFIDKYIVPFEENNRDLKNI